MYMLAYVYMHIIMYRIVQNGGGGKLRQISNFKKLAGKSLANCNELFFAIVAMRYAKFK